MRLLALKVFEEKHGVSTFEGGCGRVCAADGDAINRQRFGRDAAACIVGVLPGQNTVSATPC